MTVVRALPFLIAGALASMVAVACGGDDEPSSIEADLSAGTPEASAPPRPDAGEERAVGPAVECAVGGAIENESNDTVATANAFTELTFCGVLGTAQDVDYSTFDTPPGTKLGVFQGVIAGKVEFELTLDGATFGPAETARFGSGTYVVKAFTKSGKTASYSYRIQFDPG